MKNCAVRSLLVDAGSLGGKSPEHLLSVALRDAERFESVSRRTFKLVDVPILSHDSGDELEDHDSWLTDEEGNEKVEEVEEDDGPFDGAVNLVCHRSPNNSPCGH